MLEYIKKLYECNNQSLLKALIADNVESFIYDLLIVEFNQPFGSATRELAKRLYEEENGKIRKVRPEYVIFTTCTSDFFRNLLRYSFLLRH